MSKFFGQHDFSHEQLPCTGILITNLGTPDAPTTSAVRRYLAEFLADPRIVEAPRWLWKLVLHGIILRIRPRRVAHAYQAVWSEDGSPLMSITRRQQQALSRELQSHFSGQVKVVFGMRYGNPSLASALRELHAANARRILVLPLYPQYSATTTASTFDAIADELRTWRWLPDLRMINHYHDHAPYIDALANSISHWREQHGAADKLLFSFHGLPKRYLLSGDPYFCECHKTARLVAEKLQLADEQWHLCFQSRFGREEWLQPYTDKTLEQWAREGIESVQVCCPGFSADCLETLEEIAMQNRDLFLQAGGKRFEYIPALNDQPQHIQALIDLIALHCHDWQAIRHDDSDNCQQRAQAKGAQA